MFLARFVQVDDSAEACAEPTALKQTTVLPDWFLTANQVYGFTVGQDCVRMVQNHAQIAIFANQAAHLTSIWLLFVKPWGGAELPPL